MLHKVACFRNVHVLLGSSVVPVQLWNHLNKWLNKETSHNLLSLVINRPKWSLLYKINITLNQGCAAVLNISTLWLPWHLIPALTKRRRRACFLISSCAHTLDPTHSVIGRVYKCHITTYPRSLGTEANPSWHWVRGTPWTSHQFITGLTQRQTISHSCSIHTYGQFRVIHR